MSNRACEEVQKGQTRAWDVTFTIFTYSIFAVLGVFFGNFKFSKQFLVMHFWRKDKYNSFMSLITIIVSFYVNIITKLAFADPRPFAVAENVRALQCDCDFGSPSGHAQLSMTAILCIIIYIDENKLLHKSEYKVGWETLICTLLFMWGGVVCFSRFYFGVHTIWQLVTFFG